MDTIKNKVAKWILCVLTALSLGLARPAAAAESEPVAIITAIGGIVATICGTLVVILGREPKAAPSQASLKSAPVPEAVGDLEEAREFDRAPDYRFLGFAALGALDRSSASRSR